MDTVLGAIGNRIRTDTHRRPGSLPQFGSGVICAFSRTPSADPAPVERFPGSLSGTMKPQLWYFPLRGRAEPVRLLLAAKGVEFEVCTVDYAEMKSDIEKYPFAQCPRYVDEDGDICQSNTIVRHLGRKYGLYGASLAEASVIDMILDGVEDIKRKYLSLIYQDQLSDSAKATYWETHIDSASMGARNGGAHFGYLQVLLKRNAGSVGWAVGGALSIADIMLFDICDLHLRIWGEQFREAYPELAAHFDRVAALPEVKAYLESPLRLEKINGNGLG